MKKILLICFSVMALTACDNPSSTTGNTTEQNQTEEPVVIGGEKDENGCIGATGATWSELKQDCVKLFDVALRLNPMESNESEAVISAFILFNDDKSKLELFLPNEDQETTILDKAEGDIYQNGVYRFDVAESSLYINGEKKYQSDK